MPELTDQATYFEPFFGAGTLFFKVTPSAASIADLNPSLINFYKTLRSQPERLYSSFAPLALAHSKENYYEIRTQYNQEKDILIKSAMFLYLNLTNFNGIHRVNTSGAYNVPVGKPTRRAWPLQDELIAASRALQATEISCCDFDCALTDAKAGDFVFFDPPYPALSTTAFFQHYTLERFNEASQVRLSQIWKKLDRRGVMLLMTNADTKVIRDLYSGFRISSTTVPRPVNCKLQKIRASELIITNYE